MITKSENFSTIYESLLHECLFNFKHETSPRGMKIRELLHIQFELTNPLSCLYSNTRRSTQEKYVAGELLWYFSGKNDAEFICNYSKFWDQIKNHDGTCNSSYGYMLFKNPTLAYYSPEDPERFRSDRLPKEITQWHWALNSLKKDKDTRQAVIFFNQPNYQYNGNKDFPCTIYGSFEIRDNKLNLSIKMRSNDVVLGLQADIVFFVTLLQHMHFHLKETYPELEIGSYYHYMDSLHIYERHYTLVEEMLKDEFTDVSLLTLTQPLIDIDAKPTDFMNSLIESWEVNKIAPQLSINEIIC